jgi:hypothetical protein
MDNAQIAQLKALLGDSIPESEITGLISKYTRQAQKTAEDAGLRFKDDGIAARIAAMEAQIAALKAEATAEKAPPAPPEKAMPTPAAEPDGDEEEEGDDYAGDMSVGDFKALIAEAVKAAMGGIGSELKALRTEVSAAGKIGNVAEEIKAMFGGMTSKDASRAEEIDGLRTQIKALSGQLSELLGDQPAAIASQSTATVTAVDVPEKFEVAQKSGKPAYKSEFDAIGAWLEGQTA